MGVDNLPIRRPARGLSRRAAHDVAQPEGALPRLGAILAPSARASAAPSKKPASINRPGRRPDYSHGLIGLEPGDTITFAKNQKVQGRILDHTYGVEIAGQIFNGIVPSAQYAYKISNIVPPKRVTGLAEWIVDKTGNKISFEYKLVPPIP